MRCGDRRTGSRSSSERSFSKEKDSSKMRDIKSSDRHQGYAKNNLHMKETTKGDRYGKEDKTSVATHKRNSGALAKKRSRSSSCSSDEIKLKGTSRRYSRSISIERESVKKFSSLGERNLKKQDYLMTKAKDRSRNDEREGGKEDSDKRKRSSRSHSRERRRQRDRSPYRSKRRSRSRNRRDGSPRRRRSRNKGHRSRSRSKSYERRRYHRRRSNSRERYRRYRRRSHSASRSRSHERQSAREKSKGRPGASSSSKVGSLPLSTTTGAMTPQMALQQTMAVMNAKAQALTGVELPKYYNPAAVNPLKYAEQVQKRKLLWQPKPQETEEMTKGSVWDKLKFAQDQDGKMTAKFRKLMGMKGEEDALSEDPSRLEDNISSAPLQKQEELFRDLDQQYEMARMSTHTHRGVGLGYSSQAIFPPLQKP